MNLNFNKAAILLAGVAMLTGCGSGNKDKSDDKKFPVVELQGYEYDAVALLADSLRTGIEGGEYMRISGRGMLPARIGDADITALRDSLERLGAVTLIDDHSAEPRLANGSTLTNINPQDEGICSASSNTLSLALCTPLMVVWKDYTFGYLCPSAHGVYNTTFVNYSIEKKKILTVADIMKPGYEKELTAMLREKLKDEDVDVIVDENEIGIPADFEVTADGINFIYGLYEIAPYAAGEVKVEFDSFELDSLFAPGMRTILFGEQSD